jgi:hypothetical protein
VVPAGFHAELKRENVLVLAARSRPSFAPLRRAPERRTERSAGKRGDLAIGPPGDRRGHPARRDSLRDCPERRAPAPLRSGTGAPPGAPPRLFSVPGHAFSMTVARHGQPAPGRGSIVSPGGAPGPPGDGVQGHPRVPHPAPLSRCLRKAPFSEQDELIIGLYTDPSQGLF